MSDQKKKNKLDLEYNRNSQFFNTIIIILVTYLIAVIIALLTEQIKIGRNAPFIMVSSVTFTVIVFSIWNLIRCHNKMNYILKKLDKLKI